MKESVSASKLPFSGMVGTYSDRQKIITETLGIAALAVLVAVITNWRWVGYQGHDDFYYTMAAFDWIENFPAVGANHWALRYPLVVSMAASLTGYGYHIASLGIPNLVAFLTYLIVQYWAVRRWIGALAAAIATLLAITLPQFAVQATYANPDLIEMTFVMTSFWLFIASWRAKLKSQSFWLIASGLLAGVGFITRETSVALILVYGLFFVFCPRMPRVRYLLIAVGFVVVFGAQTAYLAARTGDLLYRQQISATHDVVDRSSKASDAATGGAAVDNEGVLAVRPLFAPFAAIFVSQKYGILFILALPAMVWVPLTGRLTKLQREVVDGVSICGLVSFVFVAASANILYIVPRYFMVAAACSLVVLAVFLADLVHRRGALRVFGLLACTAMVSSSLFLLYLENIDPMRSEKEIIGYASLQAEPLSVDPETYARLTVFLRLMPSAPNVVQLPPRAGGLVAVTEGVIEQCASKIGCGFRERNVPFTVKPDWKLVEKMEPPLRDIAALLRIAGVERFISRDILRKIEQPGLAVSIYRRPA